jgi:hypothetical protein
VTKINAKAILVVILWGIIVLGTGFGCGNGNQRVNTEPTDTQDHIFYPPLPNQPRYQYLTTFSSSKDFEKKKSKFLKFIVGEKEKKPRQQIRKAYGVDIYDGIIYVCDIGAGVVVTINLKTRKFGYLGERGSGKLQKPVNLFIDRDKKLLYAADVNRRQVICYTLEGKVVRFYGTQGQFSRPVDVDHYGDKLFVCDVGTHQVVVIDEKKGKPSIPSASPGASRVSCFTPPILLSVMTVFISRIPPTSGWKFSILTGNSRPLSGELA